MKLYKKSERQIKASAYLKCMRKMGFTTKHIGEWDKWKELKNDLGDFGKLQVKLDVYEMQAEGTNKIYLVADALGMVCAQLTEDKQDIMNWLNEHGYKPEKQWYMEDYGMDEETWKAWNAVE